MAENIDVYEAAKRLETGWQYLDVRTVEEVQSMGSPPSAKNVPWKTKGTTGMSANPTFMETVEELFPDKSSNILVACQLGGRSAAAAAAMKAQGYTNVANVSGGFAAWSDGNLPIEKK